MTPTGLEEIRAAYERWAPAYIDAFDGAEKASEEDRARIDAWARGIEGPVLDAGCGPGHWAARLHDLGLEVEGVDAVPAFVAHARSAHPGIPFRDGDLRSVPLEPGSLGGVLAWFSLIHTDPGQVPAVLARLAAALRPGGSLLLGLFTAPSLTPFDHRVVRAWAWPLDAACALLQEAGLVVEDASDEVVLPRGRRTASVIGRRVA